MNFPIDSFLVSPLEQNDPVCLGQISTEIAIAKALLLGLTGMLAEPGRTAEFKATISASTLVEIEIQNPEFHYDKASIGVLTALCPLDAVHKLKDAGIDADSQIVLGLWQKETFFAYQCDLVSVTSSEFAACLTLHVAGRCLKLPLEPKSGASSPSGAFPF